MTKIINQPFGLGDIIFLQGLVEILLERDDIVFPVADEYAWVKDYLERDNVTFIPRSQYPLNYEDSCMREGYLPLRFATQVLRGLSPHDYSHDHTVMEDKYTLLGEDYRKWRSFPIKRNYERENDLIGFLGLTHGNYTFVNETFGSGSVGRGTITIPDTVVGDDVVKLQPIEGFTLFGWIGVLERCKEFHI